MAIALDENHDIYLGPRAGIATSTGGEYVAQSILTRLRLLRGEFYLNVNAGTPWTQDILGDSRDSRGAERILKARILDTEGVDGLISFNTRFDPTTRGLTIEFEAETIYGPSGLIEVTV